MSTQWINEWNREEEKKKERKWNALKYRLYDRLVTLVYSNELEFWKYIPPVSFHFLLPPLAFSPFITHVCVSVCQRYYTLLCVYYWAIVLLFCFGCSFCFVLFYFISFYSFFFVFVLVSSVFFQGGVSFQCDSVYFEFPFFFWNRVTLYNLGCDFLEIRMQ